MTKLQDHIDSAGRLAAIISDLSVDTTPLDVLTWCAEANIGLARETKLNLEALTYIKEH
jgi:hypothetical protein